MSSTHNPTASRANGTAFTDATDNESPLLINKIVRFSPLNTRGEGNR